MCLGEARNNIYARLGAETEFRAMAIRMSELLRLKIILDELKITRSGLITSFYDKKSAINTTHNPVQHNWTNDVEIDRHFIREARSTIDLYPFMSSEIRWLTMDWLLGS